MNISILSTNAANSHTPGHAGTTAAGNSPGAAPADAFSLSAQSSAGIYKPVRCAQPVLEKSAVELKADIEQLYGRILDDAYVGNKRTLWESLIESAEKYLRKPESFDEPDFGPLQRKATGAPGISFVCLQAPQPYLAGTMSRNWNYIQEKSGDSVRLQKIGSDDPTHIMDSRLWSDGSRECMTVLGISKLSSSQYVPGVTVYGRSGDGWEPRKDMFVTNTDTLEGHQLFLSADGSMAIDCSSPSSTFMRMEFDGATNRILIKGGREEYPLELRNGKYTLHVKTEAEKAAEELEQTMGKWLSGQANREGSIIQGKDTVVIEGVKLPVRKLN